MRENKPLPKYQLMPQMDPVEYAALMQNIKEHGVKVAVEYDEDGEILDGHHRVAICGELGIANFPKVIREGLSEQEKRSHVRSLNLTRRHLTRPQRQRLIAEQIRDTPTISNRAIAARLGVDHKTVAASRKNLRRRGEIPHVEALTDTLGRSQPAKKQRVTYLDNTPESRNGTVMQAKKIRAENQKASHQNRLKVAASAAKGDAPLPERKYPVIYADPPWRFQTYSKVTGQEKSPENHYPTMPIDEIYGLCEGGNSPATDSAALFLWATVPMMPEGLECMKRWGFNYKSHWMWNKQYPGEQTGTGYWGFNCHELLLIGTRGDFPAPLPGTQPRSVQDAPVGDHSEKPALFAEIIEGLYPDIPKLEMFCRDPREGWDVWGNQASARGEASQENDVECDAQDSDHQKSEAEA